MSERENIVRLVKTAVKALEEKKASDITVIDISGVSTVADFFIIASAENIRQTAALCDNTEEARTFSSLLPQKISVRRQPSVTTRRRRCTRPDSPADRWRERLRQTGS